MIGFNNRGFAGKTRAELADEAEADRILDEQAEFVDNFGAWADRYQKRIETSVDLLNGFSYLHREWFWVLGAFFGLTCFILGWNCHMIYFKATGGNLAEAIGAILRRVIFGF